MTMVNVEEIARAMGAPHRILTSPLLELAVKTKNRSDGNWMAAAELLASNGATKLAIVVVACQLADSRTAHLLQAERVAIKDWLATLKCDQLLIG